LPGSSGGAGAGNAAVRHFFPHSPAKLSATRTAGAMADFSAAFLANSGPGEQSCADGEETDQRGFLLRERDPEGRPLLVSAFQAANVTAIRTSSIWSDPSKRPFRPTSTADESSKARGPRSRRRSSRKDRLPTTREVGLLNERAALNRELTPRGSPVADAWGQALFRCSDWQGAPGWYNQLALSLPGSEANLADETPRLSSGPALDFGPSR
jgi:hypothetical protein